MPRGINAPQRDHSPVGSMPRGIHSPWDQCPVESILLGRNLQDESPWDESTVYQIWMHLKFLRSCFSFITQRTSSYDEITLTIQCMTRNKFNILEINVNAARSANRTPRQSSDLKLEARARGGGNTAEASEPSFRRNTMTSSRRRVGGAIVTTCDCWSGRLVLVVT